MSEFTLLNNLLETISQGDKARERLTALKNESDKAEAARTEARAALQQAKAERSAAEAARTDVAEREQVLAAKQAQHVKDTESMIATRDAIGKQNAATKAELAEGKASHGQRAKELDGMEAKLVAREGALIKREAEVEAKRKAAEKIIQGYKNLAPVD